MKKLLYVACAHAALALSTVSAVAQYQAEFKMSSAGNASIQVGQVANDWAELVREKTKGRVNMKIYFGQSLTGGDFSKVFASVRQGVIDGAVDGFPTFSSQVPALNLFSLPFLFPSYEALQAVIEGEAGKAIFAQIESLGVVPLAIGYNGFREISNSKHEVRLPQHLQGLKIRVVSPMMREIFEALGANPTQMSFSDLQAALASGAVDGQEQPLGIFQQAKIYSLNQKFLTITHYMNDGLLLIVSRQAWNSWSPEDRELVREAAREASRRSLDRVRGQNEERMIKELEAEGVKIARLTDDGRRAFVDAVKAVHAKWAASIGADLVDKALKDTAGK